MNYNIELILAIIGALTLGYATFKGLKWLFTNPLKAYIRKQVVKYLKELQDE
jgi:hypothetical protein